LDTQLKSSLSCENTKFFPNMSIITNITKDHEEFKTYFREYLKQRSLGNLEEANKWYNQFAWEVARHTVAEEIVLLPYMEKHLLADVSENLRENLAVKELLSKLEALKVFNPEFDIVARDLMKHLEEHSSKFENVEFPHLVKSVDVVNLNRLGEKYNRYKNVVPTRPHLSAPNKPPFETIVGFFTMPVDKFKDYFRNFPTTAEVKKLDSLVDKNMGTTQL